LKTPEMWTGGWVRDPQLCWYWQVSLRHCVDDHLPAIS